VLIDARNVATAETQATNPLVAIVEGEETAVFIESLDDT
jgi:hypothetical protein